MRAVFSGMRIQLCELCWGPLFDLISEFQPARPVFDSVCSCASCVGARINWLWL